MSTNLATNPQTPPFPHKHGHQPRPLSDRLLRWSTVLLVATVWISTTLFGLYILAFYAGALVDGQMEQWNQILPQIYEPETPGATAGIGLHFAAGGVILALGCIQLMGGIRTRFPGVHRWLGRLYVTASFLAGVGGLWFILAKGTVGGPVMNVGFFGYGVLTVLAAVETIRHARAGRMDRHRAWALRLFALAIGSWLYRIDYGFWIMLTDAAGHTDDFRGPFDMVMSFFFYLPNLLVVEIFLRAKSGPASSRLKIAAASTFTVVTLVLGLSTFMFAKIFWVPPILARLGL